MNDPSLDELPSDPDDRLARIGDDIATRVERAIPTYLARRVDALIEAWGRLSAEDASTLRGAIADAAPEIAVTVAAELRTLFARSAASQDRTPLEVVGGIVVVPSELLAHAGIPPVVRDDIDERLRPDDPYDLAPRALADLGDPDLGPLQLAWGLTKHRALRRNP